MSDRVIIVLTGAAARGAFQVGALFRVIPALLEQGYRPSVFLGSSIGAINAGIWGSFAHLEIDDAIVKMREVWMQMSADRVHRNPAFTLPLTDAPRMLMALLGRGSGAPALLDTTPLQTFGPTLLDFGKLHQNIADGHIDGVGVTATRVATARHQETEDGARPRPRTVVFIDAPTQPTHRIDDPVRGVDVCETHITAQHLLASGAIPVGFPPIWVDTPADQMGWYVDGGIRVNAPMRPAVALDAQRIVVIDSMPLDPGLPFPPADPGDPMPPLSDITAMLLDATLGNESAEDIRLLRTRNLMLAQALAADAHLKHSDGTPMHVTPYMVISPQAGVLREMAQETITRKTRSPWGLASNSSSVLLSRFLKMLGNGPGTWELFSYLYFDPDYFTAQIAAGEAAADKAIAEGWLDHDPLP